MPFLRRQDASLSLLIWVRHREVALHAVGHGLFERGKRRVVARGAKFLHASLGEVLIARPDFWRDVDVLDDRRAAAGLAGRLHQIAEAAGLAGAEVEQPALPPLAPQPQ